MPWCRCFCQSTDTPACRDPRRTPDELVIFLRGLSSAEPRCQAGGGLVANPARHRSGAPLRRLCRRALDTLSSTADIGWQLKGHWDPAARQLFGPFKPLLDFELASAAWVIAQLGQSLDGCVATRTGDSSFIHRPENLLHLHRLRAVCDAVIVAQARWRSTTRD